MWIFYFFVINFTEFWIFEPLTWFEDLQFNLNLFKFPIVPNIDFWIMFLYYAEFLFKFLRVIFLYFYFPLINSLFQVLQFAYVYNYSFLGSSIFKR